MAGIGGSAGDVRRREEESRGREREEEREPKKKTMVRGINVNSCN